ncbi:MAG: hypothetical protein IK077_04440 [Thermoguttaceae bacterium]|nr:hypothetical protein [Thermoguttaceae bacterium]
MNRFFDVIICGLAVFACVDTACARDGARDWASPGSFVSSVGNADESSVLPEVPGQGDDHGKNDDQKGGFRVGMREPGGPRGGMGPSTKPDPELQKILDEVQDKFELLTFDDPDSGFKMQYLLFVPENYDASQQYPLVMFIPDARAAGRDPNFSLSVGWGGVVWATAAEQTKRPCFVLIPVFTEVIVDDDFNTSPQIAVAVRLIENLCQTRSIDTNRLYATGQSMGGMTSFHLSVAYPDLFAAYLFVGSQWNNDVLDVLETKRFFYIVSAGDDKASAGQNGLISVFERDKIPYAREEWSAQEDRDVQNALVKSMIEQGFDANFVSFTKGTTVADGQAVKSEHLTSFDYAYKLESVREWLFLQHK